MRTGYNPDNIQEKDIIALDDIASGSIIVITGSMHSIKYIRSKHSVAIGCFAFPIHKWTENKHDIGKKWGYSVEQIHEYEEYFKLLKLLEPQ